MTRDAEAASDIRTANNVAAIRYVTPGFFDTMAIPLKLAHEAYVTFLIILVVIFAVVFVVLNLLLHYLVIEPVKRVSAMADKVSLGEEDVEAFVKPGKDEISSLSVSFNRMRESLKHAMEMIK